jgi:uncharacterized protein with HEPN domain
MRSDAEKSALGDILHHIDLAQHFCLDQTLESFCDDVMRVYAVTRCLEIISEASRRLSGELKARHPAIGWRDMAGAGNIYRHDYEDVAARRVWDTVQVALPSLRVAVERELGALCREPHSRAILTGWRRAADCTMASNTATPCSTSCGVIG